MDESEKLIRHSVTISAALTKEIRRLSRDPDGSDFGAITAALRRGAELAVEELRRQQSPVPKTEPTTVAPAPTLENQGVINDKGLTPEGLVIMLVKPEDKTWVNVLIQLLNSPFTTFAVAIKENLKTFLFGLISAEQVQARASVDEGPAAPDASEAGSLAARIAELGDLLNTAERNLEAPKRGPQIIRKKAR